MWPGRGVDHPPLSIAEVKERVELYLSSPLGLRGLFYNKFYLYLYLRLLVDACHIVGTGCVYRYWPFVRFPPTLTTRDTRYCRLNHSATGAFNFFLRTRRQK